MQEVQCSGSALPSDWDLFSMVLYQVKHERVIALANLRKRECYTSENFASCDLYESEVKKSTLKVLIVDLMDSESREYGCNLTSLLAGGRTVVLSWSISVSSPSKSALMLLIYSVLLCSLETVLYFADIEH